MLTFEQCDVVLLVVLSLGVLPVDVEAVELVLAEERQRAEDEDLARVPGLAHVLEFLRSE